MTEQQKATKADELLPCPWCGIALHGFMIGRSPRAYCRTPDCYGGRMPVLNLDDPECVADWHRRAAAGRGNDAMTTERTPKDAAALLDRMAEVLRTLAWGECRILYRKGSYKEDSPSGKRWAAARKIIAEYDRLRSSPQGDEESTAQEAAPVVRIPVDLARRAHRAFELCQRESSGWQKYADALAIEIGRALSPPPAAAGADGTEGLLNIESKLRGLSGVTAPPDGQTRISLGGLAVSREEAKRRSGGYDNYHARNMASGKKAYCACCGEAKSNIGYWNSLAICPDCWKATDTPASAPAPRSITKETAPPPIARSDADETPASGMSGDELLKRAIAVIRLNFPGECKNLIDQYDLRNDQKDLRSLAAQRTHERDEERACVGRILGLVDAALCAVDSLPQSEERDYARKKLRAMFDAGKYTAAHTANAAPPFDTRSPCGDPNVTVAARDAVTGEPTMFVRAKGGGE